MDDLISSELSELPPSTPPSFFDEDAGSAPISLPNSIPRPQTERPRKQRTSARDKASTYCRLLREDRWSLYKLVKTIFLCFPQYKTSFITQLVRDVDMFQDVLYHDRLYSLDTLHWGRDTLHAELSSLTSVQGLGKWSSERGETFEHLDMRTMATAVEVRAPHLVALFQDISTPARGEKKFPPEQLMVMLSQLCYFQQTRAASLIPSLMGLYFHSHGTKKRVINLCHQFGLCTSYKTTLNNVKRISAVAQEDIRRLGQENGSVTVYDNFEQPDGVREQRLGENTVFNSVTTGEVILGREMPQGGLRQDRLDATVRLSLSEVLKAPGNLANETSQQVWNFLIYDSFRAAFPSRDAELYPEGTVRPSLPVVDRLTPTATVNFSLGPIPFDESSNAGNLNVIDNIFKGQYRLDDDVFKERLFLCYGDQKTIQRIRTIKRRRLDSEGSFDSMKWILPIPALFHLKMNYLQMLSQAHFGPEDSEDQSNLYFARSVWSRRKVQPGKADFFALEEFIIHNFHARVVAIMRLEMARPQVGPTSEDTVKQVLEELTPAALELLVKRVQQKILSDADHRGGPTVNKQYRNHLIFLEQTQTYLLLKYAIRHGDIGLISHAIDRCCVYFAGTKQFKYSYETLYFKRLTSTQAATPELQRAILANSLVNVRGNENTWFETDRFLELHNGRMKEILKQRRTSSMTLEFLFEYCSLNSAYFKRLEVNLEHAFAVHVNSHHSTKPANEDICCLADYFADDAMRRNVSSPCNFEAPDLARKGLEKLGTVIKRFNEHECGLVNAECTEMEDAAENSTEEPFYVFEDPDESVTFLLFRPPLTVEPGITL